MHIQLPAGAIRPAVTQKNKASSALVDSVVEAFVFGER